MNTATDQSYKRSMSEYIYVVLILLFCCLIRIPSLPQPIGPDQGVMAVIGEGILNGKLPYRDFWEMGSPAIFFTYALMFKIFGVSMSAVPITDLLMSVLTTFIVYLLAKSFWGTKTAYISAIVYAFFSSGVRFGMHAGGDIAFGTFWHIAQRETFILPLTSGSIYLLITGIKKNYNLWIITLSGLLSGLSFVYKFPAVIFFACLFVYLNSNIIIYSESNKKIKKFICTNICLITGFIIALVPFVLFFIAKGAFQEMIDVIFGFVFSVYGQMKHNYLIVLRRCMFHTFFIIEENFILWLFPIAASIQIFISNRKKENLLTILWAVASIIFVVSHREFFGYHYQVLLVPFSLLTGYAIIHALGPQINFNELLRKDIKKFAVILIIFVNVFFFMTFNHMHYTKFLFYVTGKISKNEYYSFFNAYPKHDYSFPSDYQVAQYIEKNTTKEDMIYIIGGIESVIHLLTKRQSPSRFVFSSIIFSESHGRVKQAEIYRQELLQDLKHKTPKYIISVRPIENIREFTHIYNHLKDNYVLEKEFPDDRFVYIFKERKDEIHPGFDS